MSAPAPGTGPGLLRKAASLEAGVWRSLFHWVRRRPIGAAAGDATFGYAKAGAPIIWVFVALSAFEIPLLHFVLPWPLARIIFLVLGAWGLIWMVGLLASVYVHPHVVGRAGLRIRDSLFVDIAVPWEAIEAVRPRRHTLQQTRTVQLGGVDDSVVHIAVSSMTNVEIILRAPITVPVPKLGPTEVLAVRCFADDPAAFIAAARQRLEERLEAGADEPGPAR